MRAVTSRMKGGLEVDSTDCGVLQGETNDITHLVLVDATFNRGYKDDIAIDLRQPIEGSEFLRQQIGFAANLAIRISLKPVKLQVNRGA